NRIEPIDGDTRLTETQRRRRDRAQRVPRRGRHPRLDRRPLYGRCAAGRAPRARRMQRTVNDIESTRRRALAQLEVLVGEWTEQVHLPAAPMGRMSFPWTLDGHYLLQRSQIPDPDFPDSLAIIAVNVDGTGCTQYYFDSRGVVRTYAMTLDDQIWTVLRD